MGVQADVTPSPSCDCWRGPKPLKRFLPSCSCTSLAWSPRGGQVDLTALVLPSSTQLRRVLHHSHPLQAVTPFAECYGEGRLATDLFVGLRGAGSSVLDPFCKPCSLLTLPLEPFVMQIPKPPGPHSPRLLCPPWGGTRCCGQSITRCSNPAGAVPRAGAVPSATTAVSKFGVGPSCCPLVSSCLLGFRRDLVFLYAFFFFFF